MTSDKAIQKSVSNGFSKEAHFQAVNDIENLFKNATFKETHKDLKGNNHNLLIHRYLANTNDAQAKLTLKETIDKTNQGNRIYSIELEALELKASASSPQGNLSMSRNTGYAAPVTPINKPNIIITQDSTKATNSKAKDIKEFDNPSNTQGPFATTQGDEKIATQGDAPARHFKRQQRPSF